jgi:hypothetical protein
MTGRELIEKLQKASNLDKEIDVVRIYENLGNHKVVTVLETRSYIALEGRSPEEVQEIAGHLLSQNFMKIL